MRGCDFACIDSSLDCGLRIGDVGPLFDVNAARLWRRLRTVGQNDRPGGTAAQETARRLFGSARARRASVVTARLRRWGTNLLAAAQWGDPGWCGRRARVRPYFNRTHNLPTRPPTPIPCPPIPSPLPNPYPFRRANCSLTRRIRSPTVWRSKANLAPAAAEELGQRAGVAERQRGPVVCHGSALVLQRVAPDLQRAELGQAILDIIEWNLEDVQLAMPARLLLSLEPAPINAPA